MAKPKSTAVEDAAAEGRRLADEEDANLGIKHNTPLTQVPIELPPAPPPASEFEKKRQGDIEVLGNAASAFPSGVAGYIAQKKATHVSNTQPSGPAGHQVAPVAQTPVTPPAPVSVTPEAVKGVPVSTGLRGYIDKQKLNAAAQPAPDMFDTMMKDNADERAYLKSHPYGELGPPPVEDKHVDRLGAGISAGLDMLFNRGRNLGQLVDAATADEPDNAFTNYVRKQQAMKNAAEVTHLQRPQVDPTALYLRNQSVNQRAIGQGMTQSALDLRKEAQAHELDPNNMTANQLRTYLVDLKSDKGQPLFTPDQLDAMGSKELRPLFDQYATEPSKIRVAAATGQLGAANQYNAAEHSAELSAENTRKSQERSAALTEQGRIADETRKADLKAGETSLTLQKMNAQRVKSLGLIENLATQQADSYTGQGSAENMLGPLYAGESRNYRINALGAISALETSFTGRAPALAILAAAKKEIPELGTPGGEHFWRKLAADMKPHMVAAEAEMRSRPARPAAPPQAAPQQDTGTVRVRRKSDGKTGIMPRSKVTNLYEVIQ
jgi:hypothetical protein